MTRLAPHPAPARLHAARGQARLDRGSGAIGIVIFALLFMALAAFVVDGGMAISKRERAADLAEQAARYAAQDIDVEALRNATEATRTAPINYENCTDDIRHFLATTGLDQADVEASECHDSTAEQVNVTVQLTYQPMMTGFFFDGDLLAKGTASASSISGN